jgi:hypothetical protein
MKNQHEDKQLFLTTKNFFEVFYSFLLASQFEGKQILEL